MKIAIITVIYRNYDVLNDFLKTLQDQIKDSRCKIIIVDLTEKERRKKNIKPPPFVSIIYGKNEGYAYGVNKGLKYALEKGFEKFIVVNSDIIFSPNFCDAVQKAFQKYQGTILGGKIYYAPGFEYHEGRYSQNEKGSVLWFAGGSIDWNNVITKHRGVDEVDNGKYDKAQEVEFITGCLMLFDKEVIKKVGMWDEGYFLYYEDADFCVRAKRKGIKLIYEPSIIIYHKNAQSTDGSGSELHQFYQNKNRVRFGLKYAPLRTKFHLLKNLLIKRVY